MENIVCICEVLCFTSLRTEHYKSAGSLKPVRRGGFAFSFRNLSNKLQIQIAVFHN